MNHKEEEEEEDSDDDVAAAAAAAAADDDDDEVDLTCRLTAKLCGVRHKCGRHWDTSPSESYPRLELQYSCGYSEGIHALQGQC